MAFRWRADDGPHLVVFGSSLPYNVHSNVRMATDCVDSIFKAHCAILWTTLKLTTTSFLNTFQNFHFGEYSIFVYQLWTKNMPNLVSAKY